jgi:hypothetical protein
LYFDFAYCAAGGWQPNARTRNTETRRFNPTALREHDVRGTIGTTINMDDAYAIGCSSGSIIVRDGGRRICIGYDGRPSRTSWRNVHSSNWTVANARS